MFRLAALSLLSLLVSCSVAAETPEQIAAAKTRAERIASGETPDSLKPGQYSVLAYRSSVDGTAQPYAIGIPQGYNAKGPRRYPLTVVLHGRQGNLNEANFLAKHDGKPYASDKQFELHVFGRGNNAYRWAGETDVFEALRDARTRFLIDYDRTALWGFSMGGAGAWHLGLHHPTSWVACGAGAGFSDTHRYLRISDPLPHPLEECLSIYDAEKYAANLSLLPMITYGGEKDKQILASQIMEAAAEQNDVPLRFLVGPGMGHKFDPQSKSTFLKFLEETQAAGRPRATSRKVFQFVTHTLKYNKAGWVTIWDVAQMYVPTRVRSELGPDGGLLLSTENVTALSIDRTIADQIVIDGQTVRLLGAGQDRLADVFLVKRAEGWQVLSYDESKTFLDNPNKRKRHDQQGPIDDAFMSSFVCVRPTGEPWSKELNDYAKWSLARFESNWATYMHGKLRVIDPADVTWRVAKKSHLILFGDPGSNPVIKQAVEELPLTWTEEGITIGDRKIDPARQALVLIYPSPFDRRQYVVINTGHSFHAPEFKGSNAQLYPRLGDVAVLGFAPDGKGGYVEQTEWATLFDMNWRLPQE